MLLDVLSLLAVVGILGGAVLRWRGKPNRREWGIVVLLLSLAVLGIALILRSEHPPAPSPTSPHHAEELMLFAWMARILGIMLFGAAVAGAIWLSSRRPKS